MNLFRLLRPSRALFDLDLRDLDLLLLDDILFSAPSSLPGGKSKLSLMYWANSLIMLWLLV